MPGLLARNPTLTNPRLLDFFTVTRQPEVVTDKGRTSVPAPQVFSKVSGIVTTASGNDLVRIQDMEYAGKAITIVTRFFLRTAVQGFQPDIVTWACNDFVVLTCDDYSRYGPGWTQTICGSRNMTDQPPSGQPKR